MHNRPRIVILELVSVVLLMWHSTVNFEPQFRNIRIPSWHLLDTVTAILKQICKRKSTGTQELTSSSFLYVCFFCTDAFKVFIGLGYPSYINSYESNLWFLHMLKFPLSRKKHTRLKPLRLTMTYKNINPVILETLKS